MIDEKRLAVFSIATTFVDLIHGFDSSFQRKWLPLRQTLEEFMRTINYVRLD
jgi:hypothetical protein